MSVISILSVYYKINIKVFAKYTYNPLSKTLMNTYKSLLSENVVRNIVNITK